MIANVVRYQQIEYTSSLKLSQYAKQQGISYSTALRWWHQGVIRGYQAPSGTIIVEPLGKQTAAAEERVAIYARVSEASHRENLERQAERLTQYCTIRGYRVVKLVKEVGSGVNESRPKLLSLLRDPLITRVVVEHKDRLTRFGFRYIETLLAIQGRTIEVVNPAENNKEDLLHDVASLVYAICARLYGQGLAKRKTERLVEQLQAKEDDHAAR